VFVANMTGNLIFSGLALSGAPGFAVSTSLVALSGFVVGVVACGTLIASRAVTRVVVTRDGAAIEAALLAAALVLALTTSRHAPLGLQDLMVGLCATALGVQNGVVRRLAVPGLTTTVMTRTPVGLLWGPGAHRAVTVRQLTSVVSFLLGAIVGASLVTQVDRSAGLGLAVALAGGIALLSARGVARALTWR
jgi:uncharacterized membrane protein YoaK (UPF0700 family)